ncbi:MAG: cell envelope integrity protein TolA [Coxiellaceae bacterium]|nr:cell envelope integrity protein TolA [Coxiellaceae bacterium]
MIEQKYKKPLIFALFVHVAVVCLLILNFESSHFQMPASSAPANVIHASAVFDTATETEIKQAALQPIPTPPVKPDVTIKKQAEAAQQKVIEEKMLAKKAAAKEKLVLIESEKATILAEKAAALKKKKAEAQKKLAQQKKALQIKEATLKQQQLIADKKAIQTEKQKKLLAEQKKLQQQLMAQQLNTEAKNISSIQSQAQTGEVDKYKAEILASIQSNWRIPEINNQLKCVYSVSIAPDGSVLSVQLVKSSGNDALDQSAREAINASSPLPVPQQAALFSHFRQLMLTLSPQGYLQSVGNA